MQLLHLPVETLGQIFNYIGASFFQEDITRLTVSKQWFEFTRLTCHQHVTFSRDKLHRFISSTMARRPDVFRDSLEALVLDFGIHQAAANAICSDEPVERKKFHSTTELGSTGVEIYNHRQKRLENDLEILVPLIQQAQKLRFLRIETYGSPKPDPFEGPEECLTWHPIQALLSAEHLTSLVIDLPGGVLARSGYRDNSRHVCLHIGSLLHKLQYLRLRMRTICPHALTPRDATENLRLKRVIVNLSLKMDVLGVTLATHSKRCGSFGRGGFLKDKAELLEQAGALGARMASPKFLRILTHAPVTLETQSLDVLTGKTMILEDTMRWDEDGKPMEEESSSESEASDDDSFFDSE
ncbi:hypothetical protein F53441_9379 [Fusarium austroafricanum]|uniref:F-box domain-containing protein n=1 Tax=Fusarium austroafricanum TaxID=2364996 RepID=A0A8H4KB86_9HYPO|nr:hypothetical protein F53441_9379 [Fusarium austroafricanum]